MKFFYLFSFSKLWLFGSQIFISFLFLSCVLLCFLCFLLVVDLWIFLTFILRSPIFSVSTCRRGSRLGLPKGHRRLCFLSYFRSLWLAVMSFFFSGLLEVMAGDLCFQMCDDNNREVEIWITLRWMGHVMGEMSRSKRRRIGTISGVFCVCHRDRCR